MWNYLIVGAVLLARLIAGSDQEYDIGIGIGDITGPAAEIGMVRCSFLDRLAFFGRLGILGQMAPL